MEEANLCAGDIQLVADKLHGIGDMMKSWNRDPPITYDRCVYGLGVILVELATELDEIKEKIYPQPKETNDETKES